MKTEMLYTLYLVIGIVQNSVDVDMFYYELSS